MDKKLQKGITIIFIANIINVFFSLATNFFLPKYLSVDCYAAIKTFQLYVSYVGLLHFGYVDGVYLNYGGKDLSKDLDSKFYTNCRTMQIFQLVVTGVLLAISVISKDIIMILFVASIFPQNMANYYKFLYQSTGEFRLYGNIVNITTISTFVVNMVLLFIFKINDYVYYISFYVILYFVIWLYLDIYFKTHHSIAKGKIFDISELVLNIKTGILLTFGNLASMLLTSMDRWFVKFLMNTLAFAQYSFAVSVENFLNLAITPVTTTLYNYFCKEKNENKHREILQYIIIFASILPAAAFPVKFILAIYLTNYLEASTIIFLLFAAQMFYIVIKAVYVNLYKVQRKQTLYFRNLILILVLGFVLNCICYKIMKNKEAFAVGTLFSAIIWYLMSSNDFKYLKLLPKEKLYQIFELITFVLCGSFLKPVIGLFVYLGFTFIALKICMNEAFISIINVIKKYFLKLLVIIPRN